MADDVAVQTLHDGPRNLILKLTGVSDGTGESLVKKVDVSTLSGSPTEVRIQKIDYILNSAVVDLFWEATPNVLIARLGGDYGELHMEEIAGLPNNASAGGTGDILLTTETPISTGDSYTIILHMKKKYKG